MNYFYNVIVDDEEQQKVRSFTKVEIIRQKGEDAEVYPDGRRKADRIKIHWIEDAKKHTCEYGHTPSQEFLDAVDEFSKVVAAQVSFIEWHESAETPDNPAVKRLWVLQQMTDLVTVECIAFKEDNQLKAETVVITAQIYTTGKIILNPVLVEDHRDKCEKLCKQLFKYQLESK